MTTPLTLVATLVAKAGSEDELQQTLQDLQGASRAEADCINTTFIKMQNSLAPSIWLSSGETKRR